ncbi:MAG: peptidoglycan hydrolase FlgJ [Petroclostridium sp.]|jgi:flagellar protein FlgJ|uniref:rod-binding protein n=1 Tax=Petroclostridium xylanilyticum TaxID=1792311 RepID=UPI000B98C5D3|nr:rod-binding protein [Petroclostridium xylanilyticum]MBZ4645067.1 flagellar biosynthesis protein FlgJ [Clostridia bacterium]MDK2810013.1 peptidoglycan hydrolase FlgJ [Petroclostridium sp.]
MKIDSISLGAARTDTVQFQTGSVKDNSFQDELQKAFDQKDEKKLREACRGFEQLFMNMVYKQMKATVLKSELVPNSFARETFESMLDEEFVSKASEGRGMGLGEMLFKQLSAKMESMYKPLSSNEKTNEGTEDEKE